MPNCVNYNCDPLGDHTIAAACGDSVKGGSSNIIILECDHTITNPSSATQINDNITAGKAKIVSNVKVGFAKPSPVTADSQTSCGQPGLVTYNRAGTLKDGNISSTNIDFYRLLAGGRTIGGMILLECYDSGDAPYVTFIDAEIKVTGGRVLPDVNTQFQLFDMDYTWTSKLDPQRYDAPVGVTDGTQTFN